MRELHTTWLDTPLAVPTILPACESPSVRVNPHTGRIIALSPAFRQLYGAGADALIGAAIIQLWPADCRPIVTRQMEDVVLLGWTVLEPLALGNTSRGTRHDATARYEHRGAEHVEVIFAAAVAPAHAAMANEPWRADWRDEVPGPEAPGFAAVLAGGPPAEARQAHEAGVAAREQRPTRDAVSAVPIEAQGQTAMMPESAARRDSGARSDATKEANPGPQAGMVLALSALEAAGAVAAALDAAGRVVAFTTSFRTFVGAGFDPMAHRFTEGVKLSDASAAAIEDARACGRGQSVRVELPGQRQPVVVEWLPVGEPGAGLVIFTSAPNLDQAAQLRIQAQVVAQISHDVRDQLAAIGSGLNTLLEQLPPDSPQRDYIERLRVEANHAINIVKDGLDYARPGCSTPTRVNLGDLVQETVDHFRPRAAATGVKLDTRLCPELLLMGDRTGLARIFNNLVDNALHAMPCGGVLSIAAAPEVRGVSGWRIVVADTGVGIKPERLATIFDPAVSHREGGTGLGLAITRRYAVDHGGQIYVESVEGQGTTFTLWLPQGDTEKLSND